MPPKKAFSYTVEPADPLATQPDMKQYCCGNCGGTVFGLYTDRDEEWPELVDVECVTCGATSQV